MKHRSVYWVGLFLMCCQCAKDDLNVVFRMDYPNLQLTIPAGLNTIDSHFFILREIPTNKSFFFGSIDEATITEITPSFARINAIQNFADFAFVDEVVIRICEDNAIFTKDDVNTKCRREIFFREAIPLNTGTVIEMIPNSTNLKSILTGETFTVVFVLKRLRGFSNLDITSRLEFQFEAKR